MTNPVDVSIDAMNQAIETQRECQASMAHALLSSGLSLIPLPYIADHQVGVSQGVYAAAKKIVNEREVP